MITIEFGKSEQTSLDKNSMFIKFYGSDFKENISKIKSFWVRAYLPKTHEWEVPYSCYSDIINLYEGQQIKLLNDPPKASFVQKSDILQGIDFNGYQLYDYQIDGVEYGLNHNNFLLLDEQRLYRWRYDS